ncbi:hypothetical protein EDB85DRAFT_1888438 [Lactarius pseudohatsudake]|nr:hypothetical protein EDB85DRAFT_1888438 [Lactarius pseudohatsudake]
MRMGEGLERKDVAEDELGFGPVDSCCRPLVYAGYFRSSPPQHAALTWLARPCHHSPTITPHAGACNCQPTPTARKTLPPPQHGMQDPAIPTRHVRPRHRQATVTPPRGTQSSTANLPRHPDTARKIPPPPTHCHATPPPPTRTTWSIYTDIWKFQDLLFPDADWDAEKGTLRGESAPEEDESSSDPGMACGSKRGTEDEYRLVLGLVLVAGGGNIGYGNTLVQVVVGGVVSSRLFSLWRYLAPKNKKGKSKTTKETRMKVFTLPIDNSTSSYERLLQTIIDKHNQPFKILAQRPYIFQCVVGGNSSSSGQTMDVETYTEFQEMVELLQDEERAKKAKLTVELEKIKKAAQRVRLLLRPFCFV